MRFIAKLAATALVVWFAAGVAPDINAEQAKVLAENVAQAESFCRANAPVRDYQICFTSMSTSVRATYLREGIPVVEMVLVVLAAVAGILAIWLGPTRLATWATALAETKRA